MNGKPLLVAIVGVALIAIAAIFILGDGSLFGGGSSSDDTPTDGDGPLTADTDTTTDDADGPAERGGALFGRGTNQVGSGDALGRLLSFDSKTPVEGASVKLTGVGFGNEDVNVGATSGPDGRFHLPRVPAGAQYVLTVNAGDAGTREVREIGVRAGGVEDLGTIWVGESGMLEGYVLDTLDKGIRGADVQVHPGAMSMEDMMTDFAELLARLDRDPEPIARAETDGTGRFRIPGVPPGPATLVVRKAGYELAIKPITMSKDGVLGDKPVLRLEETTPISGRVVNQDGAGIGGARIALIDQGDSETGFYARQFIEVADDGRFVIESPPNASRLVAVVAAPDYPTMVHQLTVDKREGIVITLVGGATLTIRIWDEVVDGPLVGARVTAMAAEKNNLGAADANVLSGITDAKGEVELVARPGFVPMVVVSHHERGRGLYFPQVMGAAALANGMLKGPKEVKLKPGANRLELKKPAGVRIVGRVIGPDGDPVAGAQVGIGGQMAFFAGGKAVSDADGAFELQVPDLQVILLQIQAKAPGYVQVSKGTPVAGEDGGPMTAEIKLDYAAQVTGQVALPDGTPLAGVQVRLRPQDDDKGMPGMNILRDDATTMSDRKGVYRFDTVERGLQYVVVGRQQEFVDTATEAFKVPSDAEVVKAPGLVMLKGVDLKLHIMEPSGRDLSGARVDVHVERADKAKWNELERWRSFAKVVTDAYGIARVRAVPDGKVTLTARAEGFAASRKTLQVSRDTPPAGAIELRLRQGLVVQGVVRNVDGDPVEGATVMLEPATPETFIHGTPETDDQWTDRLSDQTDKQGRFEIKDAAPVDRLTLTVFAEGYKRKRMSPSGRLTEVEIEVEKIDPDKQRRIEELSQGIQDLVKQMQEAKDDEVRQALVREMQVMQRELMQLQSEAADEEPEPPVRDDG